MADQNLTANEYLAALDTDPIGDVAQLAQSGDVASIQKVVESLPTYTHRYVFQSASDIIVELIRQLGQKLSINTPNVYDILDQINARKIANQLPSDVLERFTQYKRGLIMLYTLIVQSRVPQTVKELEKIYDGRYNSQTTFGQIVREFQLAETLLLSVPNIAPSDTNFRQSVINFVKINKFETEKDWDSFVVKATQDLYRIALLNQIILATQPTLQPDAVIDKAKAIKLAEVSLTPFGLVQNQLLQKLAGGGEEPEQTEGMASSSSESISENYDIV